MCSKEIRFGVAVLMLCIGMVFSSPVQAEEINNSSAGEIGVQYVKIRSAAASLSVNGGTASCSAEIYTKNEENINISMTLQKYTGGQWKTMQTWGKSDTAKSMKISKTHSVSKGYKYRVKAVMKAGGESTTKYSSTKTY